MGTGPSQDVQFAPLIAGAAGIPCQGAGDRDVPLELIADVEDYIDDLLFLRTRTDVDAANQCRHTTQTYFAEMLGAVLPCQRPLGQPAALIIRGDIEACRRENRTWIEQHVASCKGGRTILYLVLHEHPLVQGRDSHAVMLYLEGSGRGARQVFYDPSLITRTHKGYRHYWDFFKTTHVFCPPDRHPVLEVIDSGAMPHSETLQGLIEPRGEGALSGRCTTVTLLVICCCLRFHCRDVQLLVDAMRCVLRSVANADRRSKFLEGLCTWQCEMKVAASLAHEDPDHVLRAMRLLHDREFLSAEMMPSCGVFLDNGTRCTEARERRHVMCGEHWRQIVRPTATAAVPRARVWELRPGGRYVEMPHEEYNGMLATDIQVWARDVVSECVARPGRWTHHPHTYAVGSVRVRAINFSTQVSWRTLRTQRALCTMDATITLADGLLRGFLFIVLLPEGLLFAPVFSANTKAPEPDDVVQLAVKTAALLALDAFWAQNALQRSALHIAVYAAVETVLNAGRASIPYGTVIPYRVQPVQQTLPQSCDEQLFERYIKWYLWLGNPSDKAHILRFRPAFGQVRDDALRRRVLECTGRMLRDKKVDQLQIDFEGADRVSWPTPAGCVPNTAADWRWLLPDDNVLRGVHLWVPLLGVPGLQAATRSLRLVTELHVHVQHTASMATDLARWSDSDGLPSARSVTVQWQAGSEPIRSDDSTAAAATRKLVRPSVDTLRTLDFRSDWVTDTPERLAKYLLQSGQSWAALREVSVTVAGWEKAVTAHYYIAACKRVAAAAPQLRRLTWLCTRSRTVDLQPILLERFPYAVSVGEGAEGTRVYIAPNLGPYTLYRWFAGDGTWQDKMVCVTDVDSATEGHAMQGQLGWKLTSLHLDFWPAAADGVWRHAQTPQDVWRWFTYFGFGTLETVHLHSGVHGVGLQHFVPPFQLTALQTVEVAFRRPAPALSLGDVEWFVAQLEKACPRLRRVTIDVSDGAHTIPRVTPPERWPPGVHVILKRGG